MKSIKGNRTVINILNRLGHSIIYTTVEELETELNFGESNSEQIAPSGMNLKPSLATDVAFNNFDKFVEKLSGKNTLHDIVGIAYQLSTKEIENSDNNTAFPEKKYQTLTWR